MSSQFPDDLLYTKDHEWARIEGNTVQVGITAFAVEQLGDVTQVELPEEGDTVSTSDVFGTVESVKSVSDLYAPVSGKVVRVNSALEDAPEMVNDEPYDDGWMIEIEMSDPDEVKELISATAYAELVEEEA